MYFNSCADDFAANSICLLVQNVHVNPYPIFVPFVAFCKESEPSEPGIGERVSGTIGGPARRVHFPVGPNRDGATVGLAATLAKITDQFFARIKLGLRRFVAIEIAYQTNAECNIV